MKQLINRKCVGPNEVESEVESEGKLGQGCELKSFRWRKLPLVAQASS